MGVQGSGLDIFNGARFRVWGGERLLQAPERVGFKDYGLEGLRVGIRVPMTYVEIRVSGFHDFAQVCRFFMNYVRFEVSIISVCRDLGCNDSQI